MSALVTRRSKFFDDVPHDNAIDSLTMHNQNDFYDD